MWGFGIFSVLLAVVGFISTWKQKYSYWQLYLGVSFAYVAALWLDQNPNAYLGFVVAFFAGLGFMALVKMKWQLTRLRDLTLLLVVCGMLFSSISYAKRLVESQPDQGIVEALEFLKTQEQGIVLSYYSYGYWIEYFSGKPAFVDDTPTSNTKMSLNVSQEIFASRNLRYTKALLDSYNISYIFIDDRMKSGLVWVKEEEGLLFLFRNNETFKNIYSNPDTELWGYIRGEQ